MALNYRFGRFEVRPTERLLYIDGQPMALGARAFDVLLVLIERRERLVSKSELLDLVWPDLFVEENNLQVQVSSLRKLLGAQALVTIAGRGYRFAVALDEDSNSVLPAPAGAVTAASFAILPAAPRQLLGREQELAELLEFLQTHRLISLVGAAGIGKTSLALAAIHARQAVQRDGVVWVELAAISEPGLLAASIGQTMALSASSDPLAALLAALQPLQLLLVLDHAEHLLEAVAQLAWAIGMKAPGVQLLITSQAVLKVEHERVFRLGGLSVPGLGVSAVEASKHGAVMLFTDQAQAADRTFSVTAQNVATVVSLCRQLNGMALAIKLAAARLPLLGLHGLESRLSERLKMLSGVSRGGSDDGSRQQTFSAALDWSHSLLSAVEQVVFRRCAVFVSGFTLELVSAVCGEADMDKWVVINALEGLVDRSLVEVEGGHVRRYRLAEYASEYGRLKLEAAGEGELLQRRHADACALLVERAYEAYWSCADAPWLEAWAADMDNVCAALDWSMQQQPTLTLRLVGAAGPLFLLLGMAAEGRKRFVAAEPSARVVDASPLLAGSACPPTAVLARYWLERSRLHGGISNRQMHDFALLAAVYYRALSQPRGLFLALCGALGSTALPSTQAQCLLEEIIALECADWSARLRSQRLLAEISLYQVTEQMTEAGFALESLHLLAIASGLDAAEMAALSGMAKLSLAMGDYEQALQRSSELLRCRRHHRDNALLHALAAIAAALLFQGQAREGRKALADFVAASRSCDWEWFGLYADLFALLAALESRAGAAARLLGYADAACRPVGARDLWATQARSQSQRIIQHLLDKPVTARLMAEGARMDRESVCALALTESAVYPV